MTAVEDWLNNAKIGVIGLGYVGLPLAVEFGKQFRVVGFDIKPKRIEALRQDHDETLETTPDEIAAADKLSFTSDRAEIADCNVYIVTVPTPIDRYKRPDLRPILGASETVGAVLKPGDTRAEYGLELVETPDAEAYDGVVLAVAHQCFREQGADGLRRFGHAGHVLYDLKSRCPPGRASCDCEFRNAPTRS